MNSITLWGRLARDPIIKWIEGRENQEKMCIARYTLAVNRQDSYRNKAESAQTADYIPCVTYGKNAEIVERFFKKGTAVVINGRLKSGSYTNKDGQKIYTLDVQVDRQEFTERKAVREQTAEADSSRQNSQNVSSQNTNNPAMAGASYQANPQDQNMEEEYYMMIGPDTEIEEQAPEENYMAFGAEMY